MVSDKNDDNFLLVGIEKIRIGYSNITEPIIDIFNGVGLFRKDIKTSEELINTHTRRYNKLKLEELISVKKSLINKINTLNYGEIKDVKFATMPGLRTDMNTAGTKLTYLVDVIKRHAGTILDDCDTLISKMSSDEDFRMAKRPFRPTEIIPNVLLDIETNLKVITKPGFSADSKPYHKLLPNINSLNKLLSITMELNNGLRALDLDYIIKLIDTLSDNTRVLHDAIKFEEFKGVEQNRIDELRHTLDLTAKFATLVATVVYLSNQHIEVTINLIKRI